jgi:hypothetical protein
LANEINVEVFDEFNAHHSLVIEQCADYSPKSTPRGPEHISYRDLEGVGNTP